MCGLVGFMGTLQKEHKGAMLDLLYFDTLRGQDSTGLACVHRDRTIDVRKLTMPGYDFVNLQAVQDGLKWNDQLWLGHNRFKTRGNVSRLNAHPFSVLDEEGFTLLVGAHNGTLENTWEIEDALPGKQRFGTDSEALMNLISHVGPKEAIAQAKGAWSLVWWDAPANQLNFLRNDKRPMYYAYTKDKKAIVWASESWMIYAACARNNVALHNEENRPAVFTTTIDTLYTFDIPQGVNGTVELAKKEGGLLGKPEKKHFSPYSGLSHYLFGPDGQPVDDDLDEAPFRDILKEAKEKVAAQGKSGETKGTLEKSNVTHLPNRKKNDPPVRTGWKGEAITQEKFDSIMADGCVWCDGDVGKGFAFVGKDVVACNSCMSHGSVDKEKVA